MQYLVVGEDVAALAQFRYTFHLEAVQLLHLHHVVETQSRLRIRTLGAFFRKDPEEVRIPRQLTIRQRIELHELGDFDESHWDFLHCPVLTKQVAPLSSHVDWHVQQHDASSWNSHRAPFAEVTNLLVSERSVRVCRGVLLLTQHSPRRRGHNDDLLRVEVWFDIIPVAILQLERTLLVQGYIIVCGSYYVISVDVITSRVMHTKNMK